MNAYYAVEWHDGGNWAVYTVHASKAEAVEAKKQARKTDPAGAYRVTPVGSIRGGTAP